jgi:uncharacterized iron-regulated membrane protein
MAKHKQYYIRKTHRWLGLLLGIQFILWTIGGLYFSWSDIDEVHGDFQKNNPSLLSTNVKLVSPEIVMQQINKMPGADSIASLQLIEILGKPYYQVKCVSATNAKMLHEHHKQMIHLADASTGVLRAALTQEEVVQIAKNRFNGVVKIKSVKLLTTVGEDHEYRENPLPAYAVSFDHPTKTTVYIATELGTVQKFRNEKWRIFDFLWMLHTMDYEGRDNFGNILLRIFSIFGLVTVLSGFVLYFMSAKWWRRIFNTAK